MQDWYDEESWYEPLETPPAPPEEKKPGRSLKPWHIGGMAVILLLLIVASSMVFHGGDFSAGMVGGYDYGGGGWSGGELPDDWQQFFDSYYETTESDLAQVDIPRAALPIDFQMSLDPREGEELSLQEIYKRCSKSIVAISGYMEGTVGYNWGTGVILSEDGLILTNTHVIDGCRRATVTLYDDRVLDAELVGADAISDVAILRIPARNLPAAVFGESGELAVGDQVAAIGNPLGEEFRSTLTDGIISAIERDVNYNGRSMTLLQTNTEINEGNSGGALFNMYGQVIGITNMKMMSSYSSIEGIGFAIPTATVRDVVDALVRDGEVRGRTSIGITVGAIPEEAKERYELPSGLYVSDVTAGSDAQAKGIRKGDIITQANGVPVVTTEQLSEIKDGLQVGDSIRFTLWRDGETLEIEVTLMDTNDVYR